MRKPMLTDRSWEAFRAHLPQPKPPGVGGARATALDALAARGRSKAAEPSIDGGFVPAKKGTTGPARPAKARDRG